MNFKTVSFYVNSFFVLFFAIIFSGCNYFYSVDEGKRAPDFKISTFENINYNSKQEVGLSDFLGSIILIFASSKFPNSLSLFLIKELANPVE